MKEETIANFIYLIDYLKLAISAVNNETKKITDELIHWNSEITIEELKNSLSLILGKIISWNDVYVKTEDISRIDLKDYDLVSKESSYLIGECSLIDDLYIEGIDFTIGSIGAKIIEELKKGEKNNE